MLDREGEALPQAASRDGADPMKAAAAFIKMLPRMHGTREASVRHELGIHPGLRIGDEFQRSTHPYYYIGKTKAEC